MAPLEGTRSTSSSYLEQITCLLESIVRQGDQRRAQESKRDASQDGNETSSHEDQRLDRILELTSGFVDHQDVASHNQVAKSGAIRLLAHFLVRSYQEDNCITLEQAQMLCIIMSRLLQCSDECAVASLEPVACDLICCLLWIAVDFQNKQEQENGPKTKQSLQLRQRRRNQGEHFRDSQGDHGTLKHEEEILEMTKNGNGAGAIMLRLSKLDISLSRVVDPERLVRFLQQILRDDCEGDKFLACEAMRLLDGLARHEESKVFLMNVPGLVYDVVHASTVKSTDMDDVSHSSCLGLDFPLIRFLRKITWDTRNKLKATKTKGFVDLLLKCSKHAHMGIRKESLGVFWMLSFDAASVQVLVDYPSSRDAAVQTLAVAAGVPELRTLALQALHRIIRRNGSAPRKRTKKFLLSSDSLTRSAARGGGVMDGACLEDTCAANSPASEVHKARLIESLCRFTSVNETCHPTLIEALSTMAESSSDSIRFWAAKSFHGQSLNKMNQFFLARTPGVLQYVVQLARDPVARVRERATSVLLQLTSERSNAKVLGLNYHLLEALLSNARSNPKDSLPHRERRVDYGYEDFGYDNDDDNESGPSYHGCDEEEKPSVSSSRAARLSVQGILSLASQEVAKERIAKHHDCVSTLATFGVSDDGDIELKQAALHGVIMLVHLL